MNWVVDPNTGEYKSTTLSSTPTGIPSDPALASYGEQQAAQLADKILTLDPPVDVIYSSPFYRCLQTLKPAAAQLFAPEGRLSGKKIRVENGLGEFYGLARFDHPSPAPLAELQTHFPSQLDGAYAPVLVPSTNGESIPDLHDRIAYTLSRVVAALDAAPDGPRALLICTHAASMIAIGRALTGRMPPDEGEEDFKCFTCALTRFDRRRRGTDVLPADGGEEEEAGEWSRERPHDIPRVNWREGRGVRGGWDCVVNGDCSFLTNGEERGWKFSGDEAFLTDPNAFNDKLNTGEPIPSTSASADASKL
ncbi:phosphoglycerate mutase-like protein [Diplodia corticola]|uniref:Phosphoglycerate mutase-like protein n=1 Tax=Diplodia corticola TaxID=236234 RepID=A0A1J9RNP7_9PEZI|nr:phosphoglycerate mutase-like protein [Diplodia corticola]OJD30103.1 phosphoglycerate mutase-like protein [Diplodia corticola]